jgi:uncharacterized protein (DUF1800 family)
MKKETLWSLRMGFSAKQSEAIAGSGLQPFLKNSFSFSDKPIAPASLKGTPRTIEELKVFRKEKRNSSDQKQLIKDFIKVGLDLKAFWLERMNTSKYPLREKMNLFWSNHFVSTYQEVKIPYFIFDHNSILHKHAFGNYKTLVKEMMY